MSPKLSVKIPDQSRETVVPIFLTSEDEVEGLLSVCDPEPDMFTEEDLEGIETVAQRVADAMAWKKYGRCYPVLER